MNRIILFSALFVLSVSPVLAEEPQAEDYIKYFKPIVGKWEMTTKIGDEVSVGTWTLRLSPTKQCYVSYGSSEGLPEFQSIDGYDPESKCWKAVAFDAEGAHRVRLIRCDMSKVKRVFKGATGTTEERSISSNGSVTITTSVFTCVEASKDRVVWLISNRKVDGEPQPEMKVVCERLKKKADKTRT